VVTPHTSGSVIDNVAHIAQRAFANMQRVVDGEPLPEAIWFSRGLSVVVSRESNPRKATRARRGRRKLANSSHNSAGRGVVISLA